MNPSEKVVFMADNNEHDRKLLSEALTLTKKPFRIEFSKNGKELLVNLENYYGENQAFPKMILLDFNIGQPQEGLETLKSIKSHFLYKTIPVLILSTDKKDEYVVEAYKLGANSFIVKPATLEEFQDFILTLNKYWFGLAVIPVAFH